MQKIQDFFFNNNNELKTEFFYFFIIIAMFFSFFLRLEYYNSFTTQLPEYITKFNGYYISSNIDGFHFLSSVESFINNLGLATENGNLLVYLTMYLTNWQNSLNLSYWLPSVIGVFIIMPISLIGNLYKKPFIGIFAGVLSSITWSYYNRTLLGYYDTDGILLIAIVFLVYFLLNLNINGFKNNKKSITGILILSTLGFNIHAAFPLLIFIFLNWYIFFAGIFNIKSIKNNLNIFLFIELIALLPFISNISNSNYTIFLSIISIFGMLYLYTKLELFDKFNIKIKFGIFSLFTILNAYMSGIVDRILFYIVRTDKSSVSDLFFYNVNKTISELNAIPNEVLFNRISGSEGLFVISIISYLIFIFIKREYLITLPLVILGISAKILGLRYTIFAIPFLTLAVLLNISFIIDKIKFDNNNIVKYILLSSFISFSLYMNYDHITKYKPYISISNENIELLLKLKEHSNKDDVVISWWDYGYHINYFAQRNAFVDGGAHQGDLNFIPSYFMFNSNELVANKFMKEMLSSYNIAIDKNNDNIKEKSKNRRPKELFLTYKTENLYEYFENNITKKEFSDLKNNVYFYIPNKMYDLLPVINLFSKYNLYTNEDMSPKSLFDVLNVYKEEKEYLKLKSRRYGNVLLNKKTSQIQIGNTNIPLSNIIIKNIDGSIRYLKKDYFNNNTYSLVIDQSNGNVYFMDKYYYNSIVVKLGILNQYNEKLFEKVYENKSGSVWKIK